MLPHCCVQASRHSALCETPPREQAISSQYSEWEAWGTLAFNTLAAPAPGSVIHLLIGPEAGLSDAEEVRVRAAGFEGVTLGPRVMRTETAALAALAAIHARWGDF